MNRVRILACAAAGLALAALGFVLSDGPRALPNLSSDVLSRSAGLALLGAVLVAVGLVFRVATCAEVKPAAAAPRPKASEYRRGFGRRVTSAPSQQQSTQCGVVVFLRRALAEQANPPVAETGTVFPAAEIARLQDRLHRRTAQLRMRSVDTAEHGLAPR